jgi:signal peptidase II
VLKLLNNNRIFKNKPNTSVFAVILYLIGLAGLIAADQITKLWAFNYLQKIGSMPVVSDYLEFSYAQNSGAAFSILQGRKIFLIAVPLIFSAVCIGLIISRRLKSPLANISLVLITAGGVGNLIDRILRGYVVDFIYLAKINFAIFNVADSCVTVGVVLLVLYLLINDGTFGRRKNRSEIFKNRRY